MKFQSANEKGLPILICGILLKWHVLYGGVFSRMMLFILLAFHLQFDSLEACWFFSLLCVRVLVLISLKQVANPFFFFFFFFNDGYLWKTCFSCWRKRGKRSGI